VVTLRLFVEMTAPRAADSPNWEQGCLSDAGQRHDPVLRLAGRGRSWLVTENGELYRDGLFALAAGPAGQAAARGAAFRTFSGDLNETLEWLALRTSAHLLLDELAAAARDRPVATEADITRCERRISHPVWQYVTGRGAQRRVVGPWEAWTARYADRLASLRSAWDTEIRARLAALPAGHPLETLIAPLALVHVERDTTDILREYRTRLNTLSRECTRVSTEIGVVGTLGSLALTPATDALGGLFLVPVAAAAALYYGGHAAMNRVAGDRRPSICSGGAVMGDWAPGASRPHSLRSLSARLLTDPVQILVGARMSAADVGTALALQLALLHARRKAGAPFGVPLAQPLRGAWNARRSVGGPGDEVVVALGPEPDVNGTTVVVGGPLVRASGASNLGPGVCGLSDAGGKGWHYRAGENEVAWAAHEERLGCLSVAPERDDVLFVSGTRDLGTIAAVDWLTARLDGVLPNAPWVLVEAPC